MAKKGRPRKRLSIKKAFKLALADYLDVLVYRGVSDILGFGISSVVIIELLKTLTSVEPIMNKFTDYYTAVAMATSFVINSVWFIFKTTRAYALGIQKPSRKK